MLRLINVPNTNKQPSLTNSTNSTLFRFEQRKKIIGARMKNSDSDNSGELTVLAQCNMAEWFSYSFDKDGKEQNRMCKINVITKK